MSSKNNKRASIVSPRRASVSAPKKSEPVSIWSMFLSLFFGIN